MALQSLSVLQLLSRPVIYHITSDQIQFTGADLSLVVGSVEGISPAAIDKPDVVASLDNGFSVTWFLIMVLVLDNKPILVTNGDVDVVKHQFSSLLMT